MSTFCTFETEYRLTRIDQSLRRLSLSFTRCNSRIPRDLFGCHLSVSQWTHAVTGKPHPANLRPYSSSKRSDDLSTKHEVAFCQLGEVRQLSSVSIGRSRRVSSISEPAKKVQAPILAIRARAGRAGRRRNNRWREGPDGLRRV